MGYWPVALRHYRAHFPPSESRTYAALLCILRVVCSSPVTCSSLLYFDGAVIFRGTYVSARFHGGTGIIESSRVVKYLKRINWSLLRRLFDVLTFLTMVLRTRNVHVSLFHGSWLSVVRIDFVRIESNCPIPNGTAKTRFYFIYLFITI